MLILKSEKRIKWHSKYTIDEALLDKRQKFYIFKKEFFKFIITFFTILFIIWFFINTIILNAVVPTGSMKNTINPNDRIIANRLAYLFSEPKRFDIIIFPYPDDEDIIYVKRIIGLPGETVEIIDGEVYINGSETPLYDYFVTVEKPTGNFGPYVVPDDCYFVLGDNRNDSKDSRYWENKFVSKDKILGKVIFKYYPNFVPFITY